MKRILLLGCSNLQHYHYLWANALGYDLECPADYSINDHRLTDAVVGDDRVQIYNLSQAGSGNFYIHGRLVEWVNANGRPDYVFLQFSGLSRIDFAFAFDTPEITWGGWRPQKHYLKTESGIWGFSGGHRGSWQDDMFLRTFVGHFYEPESASSVMQQSLAQVSASINFCHNQQIAMNWCFYYDVTRPYNEMVMQDGIIEKLPPWIDIRNKIDLDPHSWIFSRGSGRPDGVHFDTKGYQNWLQAINHQICFPK